ncbi:GBP4 [Branchiostoma lanceolatum]|uniref:GBP4 protein n=1 Tax=Branchiostoma lanceolatum TaxID=7740 RepID=A0A8J9ZT21_BRALA|nr:GBP4 [Branchiostoma lanceolatum]
MESKRCTDMYNDIVREMDRVVEALPETTPLVSKPLQLLPDDSEKTVFLKLKSLCHQLKRVHPEGLVRGTDAGPSSGLPRKSPRRDQPGDRPLSLSGLSLDSELPTQTAGLHIPSTGHGSVPLCIPDNLDWDSRNNHFVEIPGVERGGLKLCEEALSILRTIKGPVCPVCIVGRCRTGKSYLLSQLQGGRFRLGNKMDRETLGIWMGSQPFQHTLPDGRQVTVVLFDTEGMEAHDAKENTDNQIFSLSVLLGSLLIYNTKSVPHSHDLQSLHYIGNLSKSIQVRSSRATSAEEIRRVSECLPQFFWLLRDVDLEITDRKGEKCSMKTYLLEKVLKADDGFDDDVADQNRVRKSILTFFSDFDAFALPPPSADKEVIQNMEDPRYATYVTSAFHQGMARVKKEIGKKFCPKRNVAGNIINGDQLADLLQCYVNAINTPGTVPNMEDSWTQTLQLTYQRAVEGAVKIYEDEMKDLSLRLPCDEQELLGHHQFFFEMALDGFRADTQLDCDSALMQQNMKELEDRCAFFDDSGRCSAGILYQYLCENETKSEEHCRQMKNLLMEVHVQPVLDSLSANTQYDDVMRAVTAADELYWEMAAGPKANDVYGEFLKELQEHRERVEHTLCQLKDYDRRLEEERVRDQQNRVKIREREEETERLLGQMQQEKEQGLAKLKAMEEANRQRLQQLNRENQEASRRQAERMERDHSSRMSALKKEQEEQFQRTTQRLENEKRSLEGTMQSLRNQQQQLQNEVSQLRNRPPTVVHRGGGGGGCVVM